MSIKITRKSKYLKNDLIVRLIGFCVCGAYREWKRKKRET